MSKYTFNVPALTIKTLAWSDDVNRKVNAFYCSLSAQKGGMDGKINAALKYRVGLVLDVLGLPYSKLLGSAVRSIVDAECTAANMAGLRCQTLEDVMFSDID